MNTDKTVKGLQIAAAAVLAVLGFFVYDSVRERVANVGDNAPAFSVTTASGKKRHAEGIWRAHIGSELLGVLVPALRGRDAVDESDGAGAWFEGTRRAGDLGGREGAGLQAIPCQRARGV